MCADSQKHIDLALNSLLPQPRQEEEGQQVSLARWCTCQCCTGFCAALTGVGHTAAFAQRKGDQLYAKQLILQGRALSAQVLMSGAFNPVTVLVMHATAALQAGLDQLRHPAQHWRCAL